MPYVFYNKPCVIFDDVFWEKTVPKMHEKVRNVCPMLVNVKKMYVFRSRAYKAQCVNG